MSNEVRGQSQCELVVKRSAISQLSERRAQKEAFDYSGRYMRGCIVPLPITFQNRFEIALGTAFIGRTPATRPDMRVRTGRFEKLRSGEMR